MYVFKATLVSRKNKECVFWMSFSPHLPSSGMDKKAKSENMLQDLKFQYVSINHFKRKIVSPTYTHLNRVIC